MFSPHLLFPLPPEYELKSICLRGPCVGGPNIDQTGESHPALASILLGYLSSNRNYRAEEGAIRLLLSDSTFGRGVVAIFPLLLRNLAFHRVQPSGKST